VAYRPVAGQSPRNGRVQPLLCNGRINKLIRRQRLGKRVPATTDTYEMVEELLDYNNGNGVLYMVRAEML
jgi:hypothetical protein